VVWCGVCVYVIWKNSNIPIL